MLVAFDNNQILQRQWHVKLNNRMECNVVTVVVMFEFDENGHLQSAVAYHPSLWFLKDLSVADIPAIKYIDCQESIKDTHYHHLHGFLRLVSTLAAI